MDAAPFLGAGPVPSGRVSQVRPSHASRHAWQPVHPTANSFVHHNFVPSLPDAIYLWHEFMALPDGSSGIESVFLLVRIQTLALLFGHSGTSDFQIFFDSLEPVIRSAFI